MQRPRIEGFIKIRDGETGEISLDKKNAIHYENMSESITLSIANAGYGNIHKLYFGNGASTITGTGAMSFFPPNTTSPDAKLYNATYTEKVVDGKSPLNTDPVRNNIEVSYVEGRIYSDMIISCFLDYAEPSGEDSFDDAEDETSHFVFDEMGLVSYPENGDGEGKLLTHCVFHPIQKSLNRSFDITYTIRIYSTVGAEAAGTETPLPPPPSPRFGKIEAPITVEATAVSQTSVDMSLSGQTYVLDSPYVFSERQPTPARYWRLRDGVIGSTSNLGIMNDMSCQEIGFHETQGGPNIINQATIVTLQGFPDGRYNSATDDPAKLVDGDTGTTFVGYRRWYDDRYPLHIPTHGVVFDFGAGNEKWIAETSLILGQTYVTLNSNQRQFELSYSDDGENFIRAYRVYIGSPVAGQLKYLPERRI